MKDNLPILLFDLDGTLIDTAPDLVATLNVILAKYGRDMLELNSVKRMVGDGAQALLERGFAETGPPALDLETITAEFIEIYVDKCTKHSRPFPGVVETLDTFAKLGYRMAVCTNKPQAPSEKILTDFQLLDHFEVVIGGDRLSVRKPNPKHLLSALELMNAIERSAIMVGDSQNDVASARNAEIPVIIMTYGYTKIPVEQLGADLLIDNFTLLPEAVSQFRS